MELERPFPRQRHSDQDLTPRRRRSRHQACSDQLPRRNGIGHGHRARGAATVNPTTAVVRWANEGGCVCAMATRGEQGSSKIVSDAPPRAGSLVGPASATIPRSHATAASRAVRKSSRMPRQPARRAALVGPPSATTPFFLPNYARSLIAAVTANKAARAINIHPDNVGRSLTTVSVPDAGVPGGASLEGTCDVVLAWGPGTVPATRKEIV